MLLSRCSRSCLASVCLQHAQLLSVVPDMSSGRVHAHSTVPIPDPQPIHTHRSQYLCKATGVFFFFFERMIVLRGYFLKRDKIITVIQKLNDYVANILFSSLTNEGTSKMLQSSSRGIESTGSGILPINIKLQQGSCHQEAPNHSREMVWAHTANPREPQ